MRDSDDLLSPSVHGYRAASRIRDAQSPVLTRETNSTKCSAPEADAEAAQQLEDMKSFRVAASELANALKCRCLLCSAASGHSLSEQNVANSFAHENAAATSGSLSPQRIERASPSAWHAFSMSGLAVAGGMPGASRWSHTPDGAPSPASATPGSNDPKSAANLTENDCSPKRLAVDLASPPAAGLPSPLMLQRQQSQVSPSRQHAPCTLPSPDIAVPYTAVPQPSSLQQSIMADSLVDAAVRSSPGILTPTELRQVNDTTLQRYLCSKSQATPSHGVSMSTPSKLPPLPEGATIRRSPQTGNSSPSMAGPALPLLTKLALPHIDFITSKAPRHQRPDKKGQQSATPASGHKVRPLTSSRASAAQANAQIAPQPVTAAAKHRPTALPRVALLSGKPSAGTDQSHTKPSGASMPWVGFGCHAS